MSCVLRVSGKNFDVDSYLQESKLKVISVYYEGKPRMESKLDSKKNEKSGFNIGVSEGDFNDLDKQIKDAIQFLKENSDKLNKLNDFLINIKDSGICLDFGIKKRNTVVQSNSFPSELLTLAGDLGLDIELTQYPIDK